MSTQYSTSLRLWEGQQNDPAIANNWGTPLAANFTWIDSAIAGTASVSLTGLTTYSLTTANGAADQSRELVQDYIGALGATCTVTLPNVPKVGWARNDTTGGHNVIETAGAGTTATIAPDGYWYFRATDGATNVSRPNVAFGAVKVGGALAVSGSATITGAVSVVGGAVTLDNNEPIGAKNHLGVLEQMFLMDVNDNVTIQNGGGQLIRMTNRAASVNLMTIDDTGVVTLGAGPLVVTGSRNGSILAAGQFNSAGVFTGISGTVGFSGNFSQAVLSGIAFYAGSDERAKDDLAAISASDAEAWVMAGKPLTFLVDGVKHAGFSAQDETKTVRRESITAAASDDPRFSVSDGIAPDGHRLLKDYQHDIAYLTRFVQVLVERIAALEQALV